MKPKRKTKKNKRVYTLYALELEDQCYYIGITLSLQKRFSQHTSGEGAQWTKLHKPIKILESRVTTITSQSLASKQEDLMTLEYIAQYGPERVRGGQWCRLSQPIIK